MIDPKLNILSPPFSKIAWYARLVVASYIFPIFYWVRHIFLQPLLVLICTTYMLCSTFDFAMIKCIYTYIFCILNAESTTIHDGFTKRRWWEFKSTMLNVQKKACWAEIFFFKSENPHTQHTHTHNTNWNNWEYLSWKLYC